MDDTQEHPDTDHRQPVRNEAPENGDHRTREIAIGHPGGNPPSKAGGKSHPPAVGDTHNENAG
eukprot:4650945-Prorocentrum_lima.AAC.1